VLIDDLTTNGTTEPYRMFTSRSEFRLSLRSDNADLRLTEKGYKIGCVSDYRYKLFSNFKRKLDDGIELLKSIQKTTNEWNEFSLSLNLGKNKPKRSIYEILRADMTLKMNLFKKLIPKEYEYLIEDNYLAERVSIHSLYEVAEANQVDEMKEIRQNESFILPDNLNYNLLQLSNETKDKLRTWKPTTIGQAARIPGITPAALMLLIRYLRLNNTQIISN
jgi:tRNA uridine 5-carboxymethylaminomethyl modification enzyme